MAFVTSVKEVWSRRKKPTPTHIDKLFTQCAKICGLIIIAANSAPDKIIGPEAASSVSWFFGVASGLLMEIKKFFVVETDETSIPIDRVDVMEEQDDPKKSI